MDLPLSHSVAHAGKWLPYPPYSQGTNVQFANIPQSGMAVVLVEGEDEFLALESRLNSSSTTNTAPTSHFSNGLAALAAAAAGLISLW